MICPHCQTELLEEAKFCKECGQKVETNCPKCSHPIPPDSKFCLECGYDLRQVGKSSPLDFHQPRSYTPKHLAEKILTHRSSIEGERKIVTVMFADVSEFTSMSEKLDPEDVHQIMDGCCRILVDEIHRFEGTVSEFRGDGVMALFGAPIAHENHAQRACHAAFNIQQALVAYGEEVQQKYRMKFKMRIGLNSGMVVVGSIGDDLRMDYTAMGDTTNLAARMETSARPGSILVSRTIYRQTRDFFEFQAMGKFQVKGKERPVDAYQLLRPSRVRSRIAASTAKGLTRFIGRQCEMETLKKAFARVQSGKGQMVGIVGEAGIGKSRLLIEFRRLLSRNDHNYYEGRCLHYGEALPFFPILEVLRSFIGVDEGEKNQIIKQKLIKTICKLGENLQPILPPLQELLSLKVEDQAFLRLEPKQKRKIIFEAVRDLLIRDSRHRPLILTLEDIHWIDKTSEEFLNNMIDWLPRTRILLLLLYRPEYTHQWGSKPYYWGINVGGFDTGFSAELLEAILDGDVVPELRELILTRTAGNPLFMEELIYSLLDNGSVLKKGGLFALADDVPSLQIPETIQGIIAARVDRLESSLKRILQMASVIGREFSFPILQAITGLRERLKSQLLDLQGMEFIYEKSFYPEMEYIFKHALIQEVTYNSLLREKRKEIHGKIGKTIEKFYPKRMEEFYETLAYHYSRSNHLDKAHHFLMLSGNKATQNHSLHEAFRFFKETINVLKQMPETEPNKKEQVEALLLMYIPMRLLGYPEDSIQFLQNGEKLSRELGDRKKTATFSNWIGIYFSFAGNPVLGRNYSEEAFGAAEGMSDVELMASSGASLVNSYFIEGNFKKIEEISTKVFNLIENTHKESEFFMPSNAYSYFMGMTGISKAALGKFGEGELLCEKALFFAQKYSHLFSIGSAELQYGFLFIIKGDGGNSVTHLQRSVEYLEKSQGFVFLPLAWSSLGYGHYLLGRFEIGLRWIEKAVKMSTDLRMRVLLSIHHFHLSMVLFELGNWNEAKVHAEEALNLARANNEKSSEGLSWVQLGRVVGEMDISQILTSEEFILRGMKILEKLMLRPWHSLGYLLLGNLYANAKRKEMAREKIKIAETLYLEMGMDYWLGKAREGLAKL